MNSTTDTNAPVFENRGVVLQRKSGPFELKEWTFSPSESDVVIEIELAGLCGTDAHIYRGELSSVSYPVVLGHENVGRLAWTGSTTVDALGRPVAIGDRVVLATAFFGNCGSCYQCAVELAPWDCPRRVRSKTEIDGTQVGTIGGGLARYLSLSPPEARTILRLDTESDAAVLHEPLTVALEAIMLGPSLLGSEVAVQGTGAIGLLTIALAKIAGASNIIAIGGPPARLELARRLGADITVDIASLGRADRIDAVRSATRNGRGVQASYEMAGVPAAVTEGLSYLAPSGVLLAAGSAADVGSVELDPYRDLWVDRRRIVAVRGRSLDIFARAALLLERHATTLEPLVSHVISLSSVEEALRSLTGAYELNGEPVIKVAVDPRML